MSDHKTVFISYRRSASRHLARLIFNDLRANGYDAFLDVNTMDNGEFDTIILNQIAARAHFVLVLSKGSLERCANEGDWLTREMREAIRLKRNIVPILEEGFDFGDEQKYLPPDLRASIPRYNGPKLFHDYFDEAMTRLRDRFLKQPFSGQIAPTPALEVAAVAARVQQATQPVVPTDAPLGTAEAYVTRAVERSDVRDYEGALRDYEEALRHDPLYSRAYINRATTRQALGDVDGAIRDTDEAIRLSPEDSVAHYNRGYAYKAKGDLAAALRDYDEAIRLNPQYRRAYNNRGGVRQALGDDEGAIADYEEAIRLDPKDGIAFYNRGSVRQSQGDVQGAIADYQQYLELGGGERYNNRVAVETIIGTLQEKLSR